MKMLSLLVILACGLGTALPAEPLPPFGWNKVPVYAHVGKRSDDFTGQELRFLAGHFNFVAIEKGQAFEKRRQTENGVYEAARQLKKLNPRMTVLFYWNAFLDYPLYRASERLDPSWHLKTRSGEPLLVRNKVPSYDLSLPAVQQWWSDAAGEAMRQAPLDGIFADALPQVLTPGKERLFGREKHQALKQGLQEMLVLTRRKMGDGKIILANGTRAKDYVELLDWDSISGVMIEHFGHFQSDSKEDIAADMETIETAARKGKIVVVKGWPGFSFLDQEMMQKPHADLARLAAERITFPLACFLAAAGERSYFCYTWGYTEEDGTFEWYPEFEKPLGKPKGPATRNGHVYTREFAHAAVWVDLAGKEARIDWRGP